MSAPHGNLGKWTSVTQNTACDSAIMTTSAGGEAPTWRRRVLPLAEYDAELRSSEKVQTYDGSASAPIPVPLFDGETEEEYEEAFVRTLSNGEKLWLEKSPTSAPVMGCRVRFARRRVEWFGRNNPVEGELERNQLENLDVEKLPRSALYSIKYVVASAYEEEIRNGLFHRLKSMSRSESYAMFGTVLPPVYMPRVPRETQQECEARFVEWLREIKMTTMEELASHPNPLEERTVRIDFAVATTEGEGKMKPKMKPKKAKGGSTDQDPALSKSMLERRVLPLTEYVAELKAGAKQKSRVPVPLFVGETEEEYEEAFLATLMASERKKAHVLGEQHRDLRKHFARRRATWCVKDKGRPEFEVNADDLENLSVSSLPREALYNMKYVTRPPYQAHVKSGYFDRLKKMSRTETVALFRNVVPPIFMPMAYDEKPKQCEDRFIRWLHNIKNTTLDELVNSADAFEERRCRIEFAATTGMIREKGKKRKHQQQLRAEKRRKCEDEATGDGCKGHDAIADCVAWGCVNCLARGRQLLQDKVNQVVSMSSPVHDRADALVGSTMQSNPHYRLASVVTAIDTQPTAKLVETELVREYEEINDEIVMNEKALEDSATRLAVAPVTDIHGTSQFLAENEEMSALIDHEIGNRNAALALLIVFMWRKDVDQLRTMVNDPAATNVLHIHRASHHKCAALSTEMKEERQKVDELKAEDPSTADQEDLVSLVAKTEEKLQQLTEQRRREFVRLVRFDESLRVLVRELLTRV